MVEEAHRKSVEASAKAEAANAQERAAAQQAANEAESRYAALQSQLETSQQALKQEEAKARQQAEKLQRLETELVELSRKNPPQLSPADVAQTANGIPSCEQNAAAVRDPETGLWLVCEAQIIVSAQTADVGTTRHPSGRYYMLPFPDHSMMFVGAKAVYKYACGEHFCEWLKQGGSLDIEYGAASGDGTFHRFSSCRTGLENRRICAVPVIAFPEGVYYQPDGREPEVLMVGPDVDATDVSGSGGFRAGAARRAPAACVIGTQGQAVPVLPWPGRERFHQRADGTWQALFYGGNCVGDVRVETSNPDAPDMVIYSTSTSESWPRFHFEAAGPDGKRMELFTDQIGPGIPLCDGWLAGGIGRYHWCYQPVPTNTSTETGYPSAVPSTPAPSFPTGTPDEAASEVPTQAPAVTPEATVPEPSQPAPVVPAPAPVSPPAEEPAQQPATETVPAAGGTSVPATPAADDVVAPAVPVPAPAGTATGASTAA